MLGVISKDLALRIWSAHDEIEKGEKLQDIIAKAISEHRVPDLRDSFGRPRGLELGVPSGENGHRLLDVQPALALSVINAHIADKKAVLAALMAEARSVVVGLPA